MLFSDAIKMGLVFPKEFWKTRKKKRQEPALEQQEEKPVQLVFECMSFGSKK